MFNEKNKAIKLLQEGLTDNYNVRTAVLFLSKFYKYLGYDKENGTKIIRDWIYNQDLNDTNMTFTLSIDKLEDYVEDALNKIPNNIFSRNYKFIDEVNIPITLSEIEYINKLKSKGDKLVAFALIYLSKIFSGEDNYFYCRHSLLCKLTGISNRQVRYIIVRLESHGFIDVIRDEKGYKSIVKHNGYGKRYSKPNRYKINIKEGDVEILRIPDTENLLCYFVNALYICMVKYNLKLTVRLKQFVMREKCKD